jgi:hypothetical protein
LEYVKKYNNWYCESCARYREPEIEETDIQKQIYFESPLFGTMKNKQAVSVILLIFFLIIIPVYLSLLPNYKADQKIEPQDDWREWPIYAKQITESGYTNENSNDDFEFELNEEYTTSINFNLIWTDEGSSYFGGINEPDMFKLTVFSPTSENIEESDFRLDGWVYVEITLDPDEYRYTDNYLGTWRILIEAGDCGDDGDRFGMRTTPDTGNDWYLEIVYNYHIKVDLD